MVPASLGVSTLSKMDEPPNPEEKEDMLKFLHREAMGALMRMVTITRPDIACAVRAVTRFCEKLELAHRKTVLNVM